MKICVGSGEEREWAAQDMTCLLGSWWRFAEALKPGSLSVWPYSTGKLTYWVKETQELPSEETYF